jgi:hypothetical protein
MSIQVTSTTEQPKAAPAQKAEAVKADENVAQSKEVVEDSSASTEQSEDETAEESDASEKEDGDEVESQEARPKKSKNGFKRRIDKLNSKLSQAEKDAQYWREQALRAKPEAELEKKESKPTLEGKPKEDDFDTHAEYVDALTDWKMDQRDQKREAKAKESQVKSEYEQLQAAHSERFQKFAKEHDDFEEVMEDVKDVAVSSAMEHVILTSDVGPAIMYELAKNPDELERVCKLPALAAAREIGKIEARLQKSSASDAETSETQTTKAPKPIKPVGSGGTGSGRKSLSDPNLTQSEYERIRREQQRKKA